MEPISKGWFSRTWDVVQSEFRQHWKSVVVMLLVCVFTYNIIDDLRYYLRKQEKPTVVEYVKDKGLNIDAQGKPTTVTPNVYVSVTPTVGEKTSVSIQKQEKQADGSADMHVGLEDKSPIYKFGYKGYDGKWHMSLLQNPDIKESYAFQNGKMMIDRQSTVTVNTAVPVPAGDFGLGYSARGEGHIAAMAGFKIGGIYSPLNGWVYASSADQAVGVKSTWYLGPKGDSRDEATIKGNAGAKEDTKKADTKQTTTDTGGGKAAKTEDRSNEEPSKQGSSNSGKQ